MNPYFWLFSFCALWTAPLSVQLSVRVGDGVRYCVRFRAAGLPLWQKRRPFPAEADEKRLQTRDVVRGLHAFSWPAALALLRDGTLAKALRCVRLESLCLQLSFGSAAATALHFAAVRTLLQTLRLCAGRSLPVRGRVEMTFQAEGTECGVWCILSARMGNLCLSAIRLLLAARRRQAELLKTEEESYAAASH